tara:strand:- start:9649 stop:10857 length:1209 start_codon:yes stop_codon:yes gene_type:complete
MNDSKLAYAKEHVFMAGVDDSGARLCEANLPYGLAKIHHVQAELGLPQDASFVGSPDCTITRNKRRWQQGFGYGGVYQWSGDFAVLDIKTNACGMLVGSLDHMPEHEAVKEQLRVLERDGLSLDGTPIDNDLTESNHFVDLLTVDPKEQKEEAPAGAKHFFIMHSSGHEHRANTKMGPGLYYDESEELVAMARRIDTPWGDIRILEGEKAERWYQFYKEAEDFVFRRRELLAQHLFGDFKVTVNATHQGLVRGYNQANVGCYHYEVEDGTDDGPLFPLTLSPELPCYLVRGKRNVSDAAMSALGWDERLDKHGLRERIADTNLLPHGGGYRYNQFSGVANVVQEGPDNRFFELQSTTPGEENPRIATPRDLPYAYRGMEVKDRMVELGLGDPVVKLDLDYVL